MLLLWLLLLLLLLLLSYVRLADPRHYLSIPAIPLLPVSHQPNHLNTKSGIWGSLANGFLSCVTATRCMWLPPSCRSTYDQRGSWLQDCMVTTCDSEGNVVATF